MEGVKEKQGQLVFGLDIEEFEYAYRLDGPWKPKDT